MNHLYYRDLQRRVEALEAHYLPEPEVELTVVVTDAGDGLPLWISVIGKSYWQRKEGEPIPPEMLAYAEPEARAAYEARGSPPMSI